MKAHMFGLAAGAAIAIASVASAGTILQIDVNGLTATSGAGFGTGYSGAVNLNSDGDSTFEGVKIAGVDQGVNTLVWSLSSFSGVINLVGGAVTGGNFSVSVTDGFNTDTYAASITSGSGQVNTQAGQGFTIDGLTFAGSFSGGTFAGVNVAAWSGNALIGSFLNFAFQPDVQGFDNDADIDIFVESSVIPLPAGAGLGLAGLMGLACTRRRYA